jgi:hypothetical protein
MFRHKPRRAQPFSDFINWTDYHWEPGPFRGATAGPRAWTPHAPPHRRYSFLQVFLAGLAVVLGLKLMLALKNSALRNRGNRSALERGALALVLLLVASYLSKRSRL